MAEQHSGQVILRRKHVEARTGLSRSTIYDGIKTGSFPAPINLGTNSVGWLESEIDGWISDRVKQTRSKAIEKGGFGANNIAGKRKPQYGAVGGALRQQVQHERGPDRQPA